VGTIKEILKNNDGGGKGKRRETGKKMCTVPKVIAVLEPEVNPWIVTSADF
jgi:hypothetical protein